MMKRARDRSVRAFTFYGQMDEPMLDIQDRMVKYLYRITDNDHYILEVYDLVAGDNYKSFEVAFTRKK